MDLSSLTRLLERGLPGSAWLTGVMGVLLVVAAYWVWRLMQGEGEYRTFRATRHGESSAGRVAAGLTVAAIAALLLLPAIVSAIGR